MREDLLHFIWKYKKLNLKELHTTDGLPIFIENTGTHNQLAGPDFFNAKITIGSQLWAGNVEIHINASDWFAHHHEKDVNYNTVILHVVWEDDISVFRNDSSKIPTLALKKYISKELLEAYNSLFSKEKVSFIYCEKDIANVSSFAFKNWLERLYFERLEQKSSLVAELLQQSKNDWEKVLFTMLMKNFGSKINGESFLSIAKSLDFAVIRKIKNDRLQLESVFYGLAGFYEVTAVDTYYLALEKEYKFLKNKYNIEESSIIKPAFFKLRPHNFPTIRLSQIAHLYGKHQNIFSNIIAVNSLEELYAIFDVLASDYWDTHYTFGKASKKSAKKLSKKFIDLLIINTILPLKFCYANYLGKDVNDEIINIIESLKKEENSIIDNFNMHGIAIENAKESQAILQMYNKYCTKNKCLECVVGSSLLSGKA